MSTVVHRPTHRPMRLVSITLALAVAGSLALNAQAMAPRGMAGMDGPMMMMGGPGHMEHLLDAVGASAEQRSQIKSILDAAHADLKAQHSAARALRAQGLTIFTQPTVDANAAEALRQQMLAQHDQASKRMMQAMIDVANVLTPAQRQQFGQQMAQRQALMERQRAEREALDKPAAR